MIISQNTVERLYMFITLVALCVAILMSVNNITRYNLINDKLDNLKEQIEIFNNHCESLELKINEVKEKASIVSISR